ncbi:hydroperoxide isomerase ALOXE3-like isoform X1 [Rana temporaria]|uniref:hydroperoxide isomerase ALOXE3-like isoform X1 n=1 Tax=Rana temporaria TaxID=8407 RepID=UPI001AAC532C|nr:hydroperoxide isomerase ALOXE3-like isoform X1 [Rana temporaria]XP_040196524.1 hydroperoxide isomerase ALOXE3-like isoform X1 [Rana temporaria]
MAVYKINVATGSDMAAGTLNNIFIILVGEHGESEKHQISRHWSHFLPGSVTEFDINVEKDIGELLLVRLTMERYLNFLLDDWFCQYVNVTNPSGQLYQFPFYQWISKPGSVEVPEGKGVIITGSTHPILLRQRKAELEMNRETYKWKVYAEGVARCIDIEDDGVFKLPPNDQYSLLKEISFGYNLLSMGFGTMLKGFLFNKDLWHNLEDIKLLSTLRQSQKSGLVSEIWKEDYFFGSQYLNGVNPSLIKKCFKIPENFSVVDEMVASSLGPSTNLETELQNGHIFLADYKILENIPTNTINGKQQYIAAPMCLLWKNPQDQLVPIAIQLSQTPGKHTPVFLPSDSEFDWLLAKTWVRNSEFQVHQIDIHLLRTHFLAEVFSIATTRQLPMGHPLYKMIIPHFRYTLEINVLGRKQLLAPNGRFEKAWVFGDGGIPLLLKRAMEGMTYHNLCLPDNIVSRGMESIPNYLYRDDGMKIWLAVESFVSNIVNYYYTSDVMVKEDPELQAWVAEIFKEGFLQNTSSEVPSSLKSIASLIKYLTMVIFTCSAQHAAVNSGQFDTYSWMPNGPTTMKSPPPTAKGATMEDILKTLPDVNTTALGLIFVWIVSNDPLDTRRLGNYPNKYFTEKTPQQSIKEFQDKLTEISKHIKERNKTMDLPYAYLDPSVIENSVSI